MNSHIALMFVTSGHSGVDRIVTNLLPEFGNTKHSFDLLTIPGHGPYSNNLPDNIKLRRLPALNQSTVFPGLIWYLYHHRPHILLTASHKLNRAALLARIITGVSTRIAIRMGMSVTAKIEEMKSTKSQALQDSMRKWYPQADAVITPSQGVGNDLIEIAGINSKNLHVIPNPLINDMFYSMADKPVNHPWLKDSEVPIILSVGSLEARKDFSTLIRAFSKVKEKKQCRLLVLGEGKQRNKLLELAEELGVGNHVDLPGYDENPYRYMKNASVFVLSSRREGASAVIVEALACGTPVVSTDCPSGPAETLQNGRYGKLVPIGDHESMAEAISTTIANPQPKNLLREAVEKNRTDLSAKQYLRAMGITS